MPIEQKVVKEGLPSFKDIFGTNDKSVAMDVNDLADGNGTSAPQKGSVTKNRTPRASVTKRRR